MEGDMHPLPILPQNKEPTLRIHSRFRMKGRNHPTESRVVRVGTRDTTGGEGRRGSMAPRVGASSAGNGAPCPPDGTPRDRSTTRIPRKRSPGSLRGPKRNVCSFPPTPPHATLRGVGKEDLKGHATPKRYGLTREGDDDHEPTEDNQRLEIAPERFQRHNPTRAPGQNTKSNTTRPTNGREDVQGVPSPPPPLRTGTPEGTSLSELRRELLHEKTHSKLSNCQDILPKGRLETGKDEASRSTGAGTGRASEDALQELPFLKSSLTMEVDIEHPGTIYFVPYTTSSMAPK
eukprot:scaffold833_cov352-Pavlova_lutheri.AAC.11